MIFIFLIFLTNIFVYGLLLEMITSFFIWITAFLWLLFNKKNLKNILYFKKVFFTPILLLINLFKNEKK